MDPTFVFGAAMFAGGVTVAAERGLGAGAAMTAAGRLMGGLASIALTALIIIGFIVEPWWLVLAMILLAGLTPALIVGPRVDPAARLQIAGLARPVVIAATAWLAWTHFT